MEIRKVRELAKEFTVFSYGDSDITYFCMSVIDLHDFANKVEAIMKPEDIVEQYKER